MSDAPLRIFIGTEENQIVAHHVLAHSIRKHATIPVEITPMLDVPVPVPKDPANHSRVGFTFTRFLIPKLCDYEGRAVYMDADMQVFGDVRELAEIPFEGNKLLCSYQTTPPKQWEQKERFRPGRHAAVMLLDCGQLPWKIEEVIGGLDEGRYTYDELVHDQCLVDTNEIGDTLPVEWNHLERYEPGVTRLVHYTVVHTQPWKNDRNPIGRIWETGFAEALQDGAVPPEVVEDAIAKGHVKPSLGRLLHLAPSRSTGAGADAAALARELALTRIDLAAAEERIAVMEASTSWKVGRGIVGAAERLKGARRR